MSKHTAGPWKVMPGTGAPRICIDGNKDWPIVVTIAGPDMAHMKANERLIAAAPDLLAVLDRLVSSPNAKQNALWDQARAAIAKAEGRVA